jgi:AraC-like DNA-binding protein
MKAQLERIEPGFGSSFTLRRFSNQENCNTQWHFHPEYEIVYISNGRGKRHIGSHISYFNDGDLIFLGPDLPHFGFSEEIRDDHQEIVLQMTEHFMGEHFLDRPEMSAIKQLFERSKQGISFHPSVRARIGERLQKLFDLPGFERLLYLLDILNELARSEEYDLLGVEGLPLEVDAQQFERIQTIYEFVGANFKEHIHLEEVAKLINMTVPAFCRYLKRWTGKTFTQFVNEFRVAHACQLLADEHRSIAEVSFESGFNNLSHFNKQFRKISGTTPREFRKKRTKVIR